MKKEDSIKIKALLHKDVSTNITVDGNKYLILTDDLAPKNQRITTKVYLGGKILFTRDLDLKEFTGAPATGKKLLGLIHRQHEMISELLREMDFRVKVVDDVIDASLLKFRKEEIGRRLDIMGRLTVYTKQLDMAMFNDDITDWYRDEFVRDHIKLLL